MLLIGFFADFNVYAWSARSWGASMTFHANNHS